MAHKKARRSSRNRRNSKATRVKKSGCQEEESMGNPDDERSVPLARDFDDRHRHEISTRAKAFTEADVPCVVLVGGPNQTIANARLKSEMRVFIPNVKRGHRMKVKAWGGEAAACATEVVSVLSTP